MRRKATIAALSLGVLLLMPGGQAGLAAPSFGALPSPPVQPASVTVPASDPPGRPAAPVVVDGAAGSRGWSGAASDLTRTSGALPEDVLGAYSLAVAVSPPACHLSVSLLAAVGQVESGNLAGHTIDAGHRAVPAIVGPALDGSRFQAVADTDGGAWDGDSVWDRALGPMQFIPSSWRAVGVDMDDDGIRDPQDIYDAAGAAMVYLCAGGRDLATADGLRAAVLSYNHSAAYLRLVTAWKAIFDKTDLATGGATPSFQAFELPSTATPLPSFAATPADRSTRAPGGASSAGRKAAGPSTSGTAARPTQGATQGSSPATPGAGKGASQQPSTNPGTKGSDPGQGSGAGPSATSDPAPTSSSPDPTTGPKTDPTPSTDPKPDPTPDPKPDPSPTEPAPLPACPVPTAMPTPADPTGWPSSILTLAEPLDPSAVPDGVAGVCVPVSNPYVDPTTGEILPLPPVPTP